jgi:hypothetical protein
MVKKLRLINIFLVLLVSGMGFSALASKLTSQTALDPTTVPQFVVPLPDFSVLGRVDGSQPYRVRFEEFQQKILPDSFYANLPAPFSAGTMLFGYGIDQGTKHYPPQTNWPSMAGRTSGGLPKVSQGQDL